MLLSGQTIENLTEEGINAPGRARAARVRLELPRVLRLPEGRDAPEEQGISHGTLTIPNLEVRCAFGELFRGWLDVGLDGGNQVAGLLSALLAGDGETCEHYLDNLLLNAFSVHYTARPLPEPKPRPTAARKRGEGVCPQSRSTKRSSSACL